METRGAAGSIVGGRYDELLNLAVDHVIEKGVPGLSIRTLADALGVAHNTVTYHFGNRAQLLEAIFSRLAERIRAETEAASPAAPDSNKGDARSRIETTWAWLRDPAHRPMWSTFFEVLGMAAREPQTYRGFLDHVANDWVEPLSEEIHALGADTAQAEARATMLVATIRGLMIEIQIARDPDLRRIADAFTGLLDVVDSWLGEESP